MTDNERTIRTVALAGYRFDGADGPYSATIQPNAVGGVFVHITAPAGEHGSAFCIDFADVDSFCNALRAAALEAGQGLVETMAGMSANAVIYTAQQSTARA